MPKRDKSQIEKFREAARALEAEENEDRFNEALKKIAPKPKEEEKS